MQKRKSDTEDEREKEPNVKLVSGLRLVSCVLQASNGGGGDVDGESDPDHEPRASSILALLMTCKKRPKLHFPSQQTSERANRARLFVWRLHLKLGPGWALSSSS